MRLKKQCENNLLGVDKNSGLENWQEKIIDMLYLDLWVIPEGAFTEDSEKMTP